MSYLSCMPLWESISLLLYFYCSSIICSRLNENLFCLWNFQVHPILQWVCTCSLIYLTFLLTLSFTEYLNPLFLNQWGWQNILTSGNKKCFILNHLSEAHLITRYYLGVQGPHLNLYLQYCWGQEYAYYDHSLTFNILRNSFFRL